MVQATEVFTPTDVPTLTYVERANRNFEADLRNAFKNSQDDRLDLRAIKIGQDGSSHESGSA